MTQRTVTWRDHARYKFENTLARGTVAIIGWLALVSLTVVLFAALVIILLGLNADPAEPNTKLGFVEAAWLSLMHSLDSGNLAGDASWAMRLPMLVVTVAGIFIVSSLIGTITAGLEARLDEMRKGRSRVIESDYTLIVGWSSKIYSIIGELVVANANESQPRIVILADRDKVEMEDDIRAKFPDTKNTRVICRSGDPLDLDDLAVVAPENSRSIIILAPESDNPDIHVIKSVLAITNNPQRREEPYHIVAEIRDSANLEAAQLVGGKEAVYIQGNDVIARVTAQTCRQSGLSVVYTELLDFDGAEIYTSSLPALVGKTYRVALDAFEESMVMGLLRASGQVLINPAMDTVISAGDELILISEDDSSIAVANGPRPLPDRSAFLRSEPAVIRAERTLILGWNAKGETIVRELDNYVASGSEIIVMCECDGAREQLKALASQLKNQTLRFAEADITQRSKLDFLKIPSYDHIILLSYTHLAIQEADARTLIALLHLRNIAEAANQDMSIVSEMLDLRNRALAQVARADDFIVSDKLVSLMISQISENKHLDSVFRDLFSAEGSEIYIRPITHYIKSGVAVDFYTLIEAAAQRGETAIGYRQIAHSHDATRGYGVKLNPRKSERVKFAANDMIIVLAES